VDALCDARPADRDGQSRKNKEIDRSEGRIEAGMMRLLALTGYGRVRTLRMVVRLCGSTATSEGLRPLPETLPKRAKKVSNRITGSPRPHLHKTPHIAEARSLIVHDSRIRFKPRTHARPARDRADRHVVDGTGSRVVAGSKRAAGSEETGPRQTPGGSSIRKDPRNARPPTMPQPCRGRRLD